MYKKASGIHFYRFPTDAEKRRKWIAAVKRERWSPNQNTWICSVHFVTGEKSNNPLAPNFVPTIFPHLKSPAKRKLVKDAAAFRRRQALKRKRIVAAQAQSSATSSTEVGVGVGNEGNGKIDNEREEEGVRIDDRPCRQNEGGSNQQDVGSVGRENDRERHQQDVPSNDMLNDSIATRPDNQSDDLHGSKCTFCPVLMEELSQVRKSCLKLEKERDRLSSNVCEANLVEDDSKVLYYTGLPSYVLLKVVFDFVTVGMPSTFSDGQCSKFQQFLIVLMRLRLNLGVQDLGYRFGIHASTVSRYFRKWLDVLYVRLSGFITWPEQHLLLKTMPMAFRKSFKKCAIIIDCFEIFTERPTALDARAQTWSNSKKHNTVKFLIGITPQGSVAFISNGWGGRVSDVYLTEHCGLLENLLPAW